MMSTISTQYHQAAPALLLNPTGLTVLVGKGLRICDTALQLSTQFTVMHLVTVLFWHFKRLVSRSRTRSDAIIQR